MQRIRAFISYSAHDCDKKSSILKELLQKYLGFESFTAHTDVPGGKDFNEMIIKQIKTSHIFFPLISESSEKSTFVNQEIGIAIGSGKPIIPIKINKNPFGFISHIQAIKFPEVISISNNITLKYVNMSSKIFYPLFKDIHLSYLRIHLFESLLYALSNSPSFYTANVIAHFITNSLDIENFNNEYNMDICEIIKNNQWTSKETYFLPNLKKQLNCC